MAPPTRPNDRRFGPKPKIKGQHPRSPPRTKPLPEPNEPKRPRGRPRKGVAVSFLSSTAIDEDSAFSADDDAASAPSPKTWLPLPNASQENDASGVDAQALRQGNFPPPSWLQAADPGSVERALRQAAQARSIGNNNAEAQQPAIDSIVKLKNGIPQWHDLWIMMLHNFDSTPYDLFTWGLREPDRVQKPDLYRHLYHILPHPLWQGGICRLRYALQKAISFRLAGHLEPLGPLPPKMVEAITSTQLSTADRATLALNLWHSVKLGTGHLDGCFIDELKSQVEAGTRSKYGQPHSEETLFVLTIKDIQAVWQALDTMALRDFAAHLTVASYFEIYNSHRRTKCNQLAPFDKTTLERWDRWSLIIRHSDEIGGQPDYPWMERETYKHLSYWDSNSCDLRFRYCIHSDIPTMPRVIEEAGNSRQASGSHVTIKKVNSKFGVIHVMVSDDDVDESDDIYDNNGEVQQEAVKEESFPSSIDGFTLDLADTLQPRCRSSWRSRTFASNLPLSKGLTTTEVTCRPFSRSLE